MEKQEAEMLARIEEAESDKLALVVECHERGKRVAKAEKLASDHDDIAKKLDAIQERLPQPKKPRPPRRREAPLREEQNKAFVAMQREIDNAKKNGVKLFATIALKRVRGRETYAKAFEGIKKDADVLRKFRQWKQDKKRTD